MTLTAEALTPVVLLHTASTLVMVGVIWIVQRVHYPLFDHVDPARWPAFHAAHARRITPIVGPVMVVELVTSGTLALAWPGGAPAVALLGFGLAVLAWLITGLVAVPLHGQLGVGYAPGLVQRLVATNWMRTAVWTTRGVIALWLITVTPR